MSSSRADEYARLMKYARSQQPHGLDLKGAKDDQIVLTALVDDAGNMMVRSTGAFAYITPQDALRLAGWIKKTFADET